MEQELWSTCTGEAHQLYLAEEHGLEAMVSSGKLTDVGWIVREQKGIAGHGGWKAPEERGGGLEVSSEESTDLVNSSPQHEVSLSTISIT